MLEVNQTGELPRERSTQGAESAAVEHKQLFAPGELLLNRFRIVRLVGRGGMGEVYEADDLELGRVALKTIRSHITTDSTLMNRFRQEVHCARRVSHPNVCRIHELFTLPAGTHQAGPTLFLTMEFVEGVTLAEKLRHEGPFPWREAEQLIEQISSGLEAIHAAGIVHRDLKTRNIMLVQKNGTPRVVLMDFGLALESATADALSSHSYAGAVVGTPDSMAPEQFEDRPITAAADIYALGVVIYEMVTGKRPFAAPTPIAAAAARGRRPQPASSLRPNVPRGWDEVIDRCLEYEPGDRYSSAAQVLAALRIRDNRIGHLGVRIAQLARRPLGWFLGAAVLAAIGLGIWYWRAQHDYHQPSPEVESWYEKGISATREGTYVKATRALQMAEDQDPRFAMAHARLAEAWAELDFTGNADREMLEASTLEQQQHLPRLDDMYVHAVRDTLTRDYAGAIHEYELILRALPASQRADGYVDLARAKEKAGHIPEALVDYQTAARLAPDSPAAFVHIAILESALQHRSVADAAFYKAEALYRAELNEEGLAEVAYQRGYAANDRGDSVAAENYLNQSIEIAKQISSIPMEIRAQTQLSSVAADARDDVRAREYANQAIQLARESHMDYWAALGLSRLGATYLDASDPLELQKAEEPLREAMRIAKESGQSNAEAEAAINLASLRDLQHRPDEVIPLAQEARTLFEKYGSYTDALSASNLLARAQRNQGNLADALRSSTEVLALAKQYGNPRDQMLAEDLIGSVLLRLSRYPEALSHFQRAESLGRTSWERRFEQVRIADTSWRLGEYAAAERQLDAVAASSPDDGEDLAIRADILLSQNKYADVLLMAQKYAANPEDKARLEFAAATAEIHLGRLNLARHMFTELSANVSNGHDRQANAQASLLEAMLMLQQKSPLLAKDCALRANQFFHVSGQQELELLSLFYLYMSQRALGDVKGALESQKKAVDIVNGWEQSWGSPLFQSFQSRPDIASMLKDFQIH